MIEGHSRYGHSEISLVYMNLRLVISLQRFTEQNVISCFYIDGQKAMYMNNKRHRYTVT